MKINTNYIKELLAMSYTKLKYFAAFGTGLLASGSLYFVDTDFLLSNLCIEKHEKIPITPWDHNWDKRYKKSLLKPVKNSNNSVEPLEENDIKATRHLILVRHGQYNEDGETDDDRYLTKLGKLQAHATGKRLADLGLPNASIVRSTLTRAQETAKLIELYLPTVPVGNDSLLVEGRPIMPEPSEGSWRAELQYYEQGPRIEAAFRKYFHRASSSDEHDTHTILVCHANVIRYFVCRALQFPPEAWLRMGLKNGSITWISIYPNGRVSLNCMGDAGHMPQDWISYY